MRTKARKEKRTETARRSGTAGRGPAAPGRPQALHSLLHIQKVAGNSAVLGLLGVAGEGVRELGAPETPSAESSQVLSSALSAGNGLRAVAPMLQTTPAFGPGGLVQRASVVLDVPSGAEAVQAETLCLQRQSAADVAALAQTHRQWIREADLSILLRFAPELLTSALISAEFPGLLSLQSHSQVADEPTFIALFQQNFNRAPTQSELRDVAGFATEGTPKRVVLRRDKLSIFADLDYETVLHEGLHFYSRKEFYARCGEDVGDGVTAYFAESLAAATNRPAAGTLYQGPRDAVKQLLAAMEAAGGGEPCLSQAYFLGNFGPIEQLAHGQVRFQSYFWDWVDLVKSGDYAGAEQVLRQWGMTGEIAAHESPETATP